MRLHPSQVSGHLCALLFFCVGLVQPATAAPEPPTPPGKQGITLSRTPPAVLTGQKPSRAGGFLFVPPGVPHQVVDLNETQAARAIVVRSHPDEQGHVIAKERPRISLLPTPALRARIERTWAFLDTNRDGLDAGLFRLKNAGFLDRRGRSGIRSALERARDSLSRLAKDLEANKTIDGWTARMVSYELGMAADTLVQQASRIDAASNAERDNAGNGRLSEATQARSLANGLKEGGSLMRETAHAIVDHLQ
ncbi:MAG: hypothetical protein LGR52_15525 [Candidatus Thiosymbion ectosymbiont of Robbea hypermnestra]|nr:hypothetical protein [Candidatus Thiosymbion ectosymbiont of Robbea hypermnestra]